MSSLLTVYKRGYLKHIFLIFNKLVHQLLVFRLHEYFHTEN